jgi:hypothetical protein
VKWLGAAGFLLTYGGESVMTAPLFTRPDMFTVSTGLPVTSDASLVASKLGATTLSSVRAIVSGHAHYDHLLDVPAVLQRAPNATLYSNVSARNLLAAYAPDRAARCASAPAQSPAIARSRVVAMDDPLASVVDFRNCPSKKPPGAPLEGKWIRVPGSSIRVLAVCSEHPDQIGPYHFGPGDVTEEACEPPKKMADWKEGMTLAFLVDFLDAASTPVFRVYYQDAPTNAPLGHVPAPILQDKRVDLALLCVGSSNNVDDEPTAILAALQPRFSIGGHWEDFFRGVDDAPRPIAFLDVDAWTKKARAALPGPDAKPWIVDGATSVERAVLPKPGGTMTIAR